MGHPQTSGEMLALLRRRSRSVADQTSARQQRLASLTRRIVEPGLSPSPYATDITEAMTVLTHLRALDAERQAMDPVLTWLEEQVAAGPAPQEGGNHG